MDNEEKVYTVDTLAELWSVPRRKVADLVRKGKLRCFRVGASIRIHQSMVDEFMMENGSGKTKDKIKGK